MAVKGKGKQIAAKSLPPSPSPSTSSGKRKKVVADRGLRRKRRTGVLQFFDEVAQDDDYDEDDEGEENEEDDDGDYEDEGIDFDFSKEGRSVGKDHKSYGKSHYLPFLVKEEELSGDELEELIRDRYGRGSEYVVFNEDPKEYNDGMSVEHSAEDPNIWRVKCMVGREQQIVLSLMHKFADLQRRETKMDIISAFTLEHLKGYVYIEADKAFDVVEACRGFLNIYPSKMGLVPQNEIPQLLSIRNTACAISKGTWVRMTSGKYKGDLGQVVDYDAARRRATIKLVPRIDLQAIAKKYGGGISLKEAPVPAPRLISSHELEHFRPHIEIKRDRQSGDLFEILDGLMLKDGYLYKKVSIASIVYWGVQPSKDELLKFKETSKAEEEDVSWLSSVFNVHKKMKSSQAHDPKGTSELGNGFNLHDLVLFGRKGFGVIIDMGKDGIKILKGDSEGQEVMTVKTRDIKSSCVDKMFTASDRYRKTISINDVVKVLDGPVEGRQGIVKHMYKGTLFIYDESQEENSGIFCSKSNFCENIAPQKKMGNKSSSSFNQFSEQEDGSRTFSMNRHSETDQNFSIGQTLRIRKGPLKGYLCRVVRIYRSDITVKLDSLVKIITVQEQDLTIPNTRRDASTETPSDIFGAPEKLTGGLSENGEWTMGTSSLDVGSISWPALATSNFSFPTDNNPKTERGVDPWSSKLAPSAKDSGQGADPWGSKVPLVVGDQGGADPWGSKLASVTGEQAQGADPWGNNVASADKGKNADPWGSKTALGDSSQSNKPLDSWAKASSAGGQDSSWNTAAGGGCEKDIGDWNNSTSAIARDLPTSDKEQGADPWGSKVSLVDRGQKQGADPWGSNEPLAAEVQKVADPWGSKLAANARDKEQKDDPWGSKVASGSSGQSNKPLDCWAKASSAGGQDSSWNTAAGGGCEKDIGDWNNSTSAIARDLPTKDKEQGADPWGSKVSLVDRGRKQGADPWSSKEPLAAEVQTVADPWGSKLAVNAREQKQGADPWGSNVAVASGDKEQKDDPWGSKVASGSSSHSNKPFDSWAKASSAGSEQNSSWNKVAGGGFEKDQDDWKKPSNKSTHSTGSGFAPSEEQGADPWGSKVSHAAKEDKPGADPWGSKAAIAAEDRGGADPWGSKLASRDREEEKGADPWGGNTAGVSRGDAWHSKSMDRADGRGRFGGRGSRDGNDQDNQGGGWGSRGRGGRGRFGQRGSGDDDNQDNQGGFGGGWAGSASGRGGRGRNEDNFGRGRGRGRGRFQSSDRNNNQDDFGNQGFSADPSSWGNQQNSWNKSKESGHIEQSSGLDGWSNKQSSHGKNDRESSKWDAPEKADDDSQPSKWKQGSSSNDVGSGGDKWNATSKNEGSNWNTPKASSSADDFAWSEKVSAAKEVTEVGGGWGSAKQSVGNESSSWAHDKAGNKDNSWDSEKPQNARQSSGWNDARKEGTTSNSRGESGNSDITREDNWNKAKPSTDASWVSKKPSDWNQSSTASEPGKDTGNDSGDKWSKPKPVFSGSQSSAWGNNSSSDWSKPKTSSWNNSSSGYKDGDGDQSGGGWRGDSFSGRGRGFRGRGRNFSGGRSSEWSGGRGANREDQSENFSRPKTFGGSSSSWNDQGGNKSDWNAKENTAEKGSWDSNQRKSSGWNNEGQQKEIGSSSRGEEGGWGSASFNKEKPTPNWNNSGGSAKNEDDGWGSKSTAQNQPQASGWNNQKQSDNGGDGKWGKPKDHNGEKGGW